MSNLAEMVDDQGASRGGWAAFDGPTGHLTYREFADRIQVVRAALAELGMSAGDRVALSLPNGPDFAVAFYAIVGAGALVVPMNPALTPREAFHYLDDSGARILITPPDADIDLSGRDVINVHMQQLSAGSTQASVYHCADDDTAAIIYTSGTTGTPKGAEITHGNLLFNVRALRSASMMGPQPDDVVLGILPMFHTMGITIMNQVVNAGATLWPVKRFDAREVAELIAAGSVSLVTGVPTHLQMLMQNADGLDLRRVRRVSMAGADLPQALHEEVERRMEVSVLNGYGLTETSPVVAHASVDQDIRRGSVGRPVDEVDVRVLAADGTAVTAGVVGEIVVRGPNVMKGYWNNPAATAATIRDGWLATGDLGRVDEDGYLYIVDRLKQLIVRGGFNVYPSEVEAVLAAHPGVLDAAILGVPDERMGEEIVAFIVRGAEAVTSDEIDTFARSQLTSYKRPRRYIFTSELPRTASGKIARSDLAAKWAGIDRPETAD